MSDNKQIPSPEEFYKSIIGNTPSEIDQHSCTLDVIRLYAKQVVKYTLEQAAENVKCPRYTALIDKDSILSLEEQIIKDLKL